MKHISILLGIIVAAITLPSCKSVQAVNPFTHMRPDYAQLPADSLTKTAEQIEDAVQAGNRDAAIPDGGGIVVSASEIKQAIRTRAARHELLKKFLDNGYGYEGRNGLVIIQRSSDYKHATNGTQRDQNALMIMSENNDRWSIYEGIIKASNLSERNLSAVQDTFYKVRVGRLDKGQKYQDEQGHVVPK